jgi:hypothetical protein
MRPDSATMIFSNESLDRRDGMRIERDDETKVGPNRPEPAEIVRTKVATSRAIGVYQHQKESDALILRDLSV